MEEHNDVRRVIVNVEFEHEQRNDSRTSSQVHWESGRGGALHRPPSQLPRVRRSQASQRIRGDAWCRGNLRARAGCRLQAVAVEPIHAELSSDIVGRNGLGAQTRGAQPTPSEFRGAPGRRLALHFGHTE